MKLFRMFGRGIRDGFKSVGRNFSLSLASIFCISITLLVVALALMASFNVKNVSKNVQNNATVVVFMELNTDDEAIDDFKQLLSNDEGIDSYEYKSVEQRKEELTAEDEYFKVLVEKLDDDNNIFHASFLVKVKDIKKIEKTVSMLKDQEYVESVTYSRDVVEQIITSFDIIEKITFAIVIVLVLVTVFLIINTIKLTIFSRKREISIMRVVGASNWSIKQPFVVEGMLIGLIGAIVPVAITIYGYIALYNHFDGQLVSPVFKLIEPQPFVFLVSGIVIVVGVIVGMFGSSRAVRKYLKI